MRKQRKMDKKVVEKCWHFIRHVAISEDRVAIKEVYFFLSSFILSFRNVQVKNDVKEDVEWLVPKHLRNWIECPDFPLFFPSHLSILHLNPFNGCFIAFALDCHFFNCTSYLPSFVRLFLQPCFLFCFHLQSVHSPFSYSLALHSRTVDTAAIGVMHPLHPVLCLSFL